MASIWELYTSVNNAAKAKFICIPPYQSVTGQFVKECVDEIDLGRNIYSKMAGKINNPHQRAYQMEYRFKKANIFKQYMPVLEYAVYAAMQANYICAYLSLLPIIEAVLRQWAIEQPTLTFNKMKGAGEKFSKYLHDNLNVFDDERAALVDGYIDFLSYTLTEVLYIDFDKYKDKQFADIFNRNLALHKLEGVMDLENGLHNVTRTLLLLDIIAELYLMQNPELYWQNIFYVTPETDMGFQLRWQLYIKCAMLAIGPNDFSIIENGFLSNCSDEIKVSTIAAVKRQIEFIEKLR